MDLIFLDDPPPDILIKCFLQPCLYFQCLYILFILINIQVFDILLGQEESGKWVIAAGYLSAGIASCMSLE
jgi:hypothetical protein